MTYINRVITDELKNPKANMGATNPVLDKIEEHVCKKRKSLCMPATH